MPPPPAAPVPSAPSKPAEQTLAFLRRCLSHGAPCGFLKLVVGQFAEVFDCPLLVGLVVKVAVVVAGGDEAVVIPRGVAVVDGVLAAEAAHEVFNRCGHNI